MNKQFSPCFIQTLKTGVLVLLLLTLSNNQAFAQSADASRSKITVQNSRAVSDGSNGVLIEWQSGYEINTIGYNIYRLDKSEKVPVNADLLPGSIALVGENNALQAGKVYSFFDLEGSVKSEYVVEAVLLDGETLRFNLSADYDQDTLQQAGDVAVAARALASQEQTIAAEKVVPAEDTQARESRITDPEKQLWVAAQPGAKIAVKSDGFYRVTRQQLVNAGFDLNSNVANWQLYADGIEQSIVITGAENGVLGANGYVEFYGYGLNTLQTDTRVYYLVVGSAAGKRIVMNEARGFKPRNFSSNFLTTVQCRTSTTPANCNKPTQYFPSLLNGEADNWFGDLISTNASFPKRLTFSAPFVSTSATEAYVEVSLQGSLVSNHAVTVKLNGTLIGTVTGVDRDAMRQTFTVPVSLLLEGSNEIQLLGTAGPNDFNYVDYVRLTYARQYQASSEKVTFTTGYNRAARVGNFQSPNIRVFDITDANNVQEYRYLLQQSGVTYSAAVLIARPRNMIALTDSAVQTPFSVTANVPSNLYNTATNKDLLIVTYKDWRSAANTLAAHRQSQGLTVAVVDIEDIYDEFSFGATSSVGVKGFFGRTLPDYAVLLGDASTDPRAYISAFGNYIPTAFFDSGFGQIVSDELLADFTVPEPDFVADFPIGRLPARNLAQAENMVNKIIAFEASHQVADPFSRGALFVNDDPLGYDFRESNQTMIDELPAGTPVDIIERNEASSSTADPVRNEIVNKVNEGKYIVGYAGHGSQTAWSSASILRSTATGGATPEVSRFANPTNRLSLFIFLTCLNGAFAEYNVDTISESIVKSPSGGVMVWSSSGLTIADGQDVMGIEFYSKLRQAPSGARVGDLIRASKLATFDNDVRGSWTLLGDPSMKVK